MILVTGSTGRIGKELVRYLLEYEVNFKVLSRNPGRAARLWPDDEVSVVQGDFDRSETLQKALADVDKLFLLSPAEARERMQKDGVPDWLIEDRLALYRIWACNDASLISRTFPNVARKTAKPFKQYVRHHEAKFDLEADPSSD